MLPSSGPMGLFFGAAACSPGSCRTRDRPSRPPLVLSRYGAGTQTGRSRRRFIPQSNGARRHSAPRPPEVAGWAHLRAVHANWPRWWWVGSLMTTTTGPQPRECGFITGLATTRHEREREREREHGTCHISHHAQLAARRHGPEVDGGPCGAAVGSTDGRRHRDTPDRRTARGGEARVC